jgi:hypothetical protein
MPGLSDGLQRLDRDSGVKHRPATAIADELAVTSQDPYSLALWNAHLERARQAAQALKAGLPSPRIAKRDPYALRGLVLIACIATFFAAGSERIKRITTAFDWQGVVLPANFRVDAWVIPPLYTGKPPVILPGELDAGRACDRQGRSRRIRLRRRYALEGGSARACWHRGTSLHHRGHRRGELTRCWRRRDLGL